MSKKASSEAYGHKYRSIKSINKASSSHFSWSLSSLSCVYILLIMCYLIVTAFYGLISIPNRLFTKSIFVSRETFVLAFKLSPFVENLWDIIHILSTKRMVRLLCQTILFIFCLEILSTFRFIFRQLSAEKLGTRNSEKSKLKISRCEELP